MVIMIYMLAYMPHCVRVISCLTSVISVFLKGPRVERNLEYVWGSNRYTSYTTYGTPFNFLFYYKIVGEFSQKYAFLSWISA